MSNLSNKDSLKKLLEVNLDTKKQSKRPKGTYTLDDDNGEVLRSAPVGHPSGRTVDPNFPSRSTDPRPGISDVQATDPRPGISDVQATDLRPGISDVKATDPRPGICRVQASTKDLKKSEVTSDLKSGPESGTQSGSSIFSNPSVFQTSLLRAGSNSKFGTTRDSAPVADDADPVTDLSKSSKPKKKANIEPDARSPTPVDYLSEADHILLDLEEFDHTFETKYRPSISNPSHGSRELIRNSKWSTGQSSHSIKDKLSSDDVDSDFNVDKLLAYYHSDTSQANQKTVVAASPVVTAKLPQVKKISISARLKKIRQEIRDRDIQANQETVAETAESPAVTAKHPQVEKISARLKKIRQEIRDRDLQANQKTGAETAESPVVTQRHPQLENISARPKKKKNINREMRNPDPQTPEYFAGKEDARVHINMPKRRPKKTKQYEVTGTDHFTYETEQITTLEINKEKPRPDTPVPCARYISNSPSALEEFAAMHRAQPPAVLAKKKKLKYTHENVIPTLPSRHSPSPPTALDEFVASTQSQPHPLLANKKKLQYTNDNIIPTLPSRHSPPPPTALDEFVASTQSLPHSLVANKKKLQYTNDNIIPTLPSRHSPLPPTALDEFVASTQSLPHPLVANKKKLQYTYDNVIPLLPSRPSPSPPTALDEFVASTSPCLIHSWPTRRNYSIHTTMLFRRFRPDLPHRHQLLWMNSSPRPSPYLIHSWPTRRNCSIPTTMLFRRFRPDLLHRHQLLWMSSPPSSLPNPHHIVIPYFLQIAVNHPHLLMKLPRFTAIVNISL